MRKKNKKGGRHMFVWLCIGAFLISFIGSVFFKLKYVSPEMRQYSVNWSEDIGTVQKDFKYGEADANTFDLYLPKDNAKKSYGLVVYLHAGGFTSGDKNDDAKMLEWLCSKGYVAAGINYTLRSDANPDANIYTQSMEIKQSIPSVIEQAKQLGYNIDRMAVSGGSAGGCLALLYAYRDAKDSPVPVKMVFEAVGPSSFYPEDWTNYGLDQNKDTAAAMFSVMSGKTITADMFGTKEYDETMKDVSALLNINQDTIPTVMAYGAYDKLQPYLGSVRLDEALTKNNVTHEYIVCPHSGHGLQNDTAQYAKYMQKVVEYLDTYLK